MIYTTDLYFGFGQGSYRACIHADYGRGPEDIDNPPDKAKVFAYLATYEKPFDAIVQRNFRSRSRAEAWCMKQFKKAQQDACA